jgi:hypothetical protein
MTHTLSTGTHRNYFRTSESSDDWKTFFFFFKNLTESIFSFFFLFKIKIYYIDFLFFLPKFNYRILCVCLCVCVGCVETLWGCCTDCRVPRVTWNVFSRTLMRLSFYLVWETLPPIVFGAPPTREPAQNKFVARSRRKTDSAFSQHSRPDI